MPKATSNQDAGQKRRRRSKEQIVDSLLAAAIEEFEQNGYEKARTAAIAQRADVVEPLLFKHFTSKFNLFQVAIFRTLDEHFKSFTQQRELTDDAGAHRAEFAREYIGEQQDFLEKFSRMFMSLVVNESYETFAREGIGEIDGLQLYLDKMAVNAASHEGAADRIAPDLLARISFGTLLAGVLFRKWLFPEGIASDAQIREAIISYVMKGADIPDTGRA